MTTLIDAEALARNLPEEFLAGVHTERDARTLADAMLLPGESRVTRDAFAAAIMERALRFWD